MTIDQLPELLRRAPWEAIVEWLLQNVPDVGQRVRVKKLLEEHRGDHMPTELWLRITGRD